VRVYLAGPYRSRDQLRRLAAELTDLGFYVTSRWLEETHEINPGTEGAAVALSDEAVAEHAETDLTDIEISEVLVLFTAAYVGAEGGGGRHVETGYALARDKRVVIVGEPENVFHRLSGVHRVTDWADAKDTLQRWAA